MTRTDDLRRLLSVALVADEPASANAIRRTLAAWEQEDAARRAWGAALRSRIVTSPATGPCPCGFSTPVQCVEVRRVGLCERLGLSQFRDDLVEHVPNVRPAPGD